MWRKDEVYQALVKIIENAGVRITYATVPDDAIDGAIWARSDTDAMAIMMPEAEDAFPNAETACLILGHEMGHILTGADSPDEPITRRENEAVCDFIGAQLTRLAELTAGYEAEKELRQEGER